ncbi:hypothetical protein [Brevibacillus sp. NRS-1366]|uniref:hypothetical protein n=1 Tax=Brevibacillus sp. NRS-1366 TaxID=3233899 RepID=UPI003D1DC1DB
MSKINITDIPESVNTLVTGLLVIPISVESSIVPLISTELIQMDDISVPTIVHDLCSIIEGEAVTLKIEKVNLEWGHEDEEDDTSCGTLRLNVSMEIDYEKENALFAAYYRLSDHNIALSQIEVNTIDGQFQTVKVSGNWDLTWKEAA